MEIDSNSEYIQLVVENDMLPVRNQVIDTTNADLLLTGTAKANFIGICELHMNWTRHPLPLHRTFIIDGMDTTLIIKIISIDIYKISYFLYSFCNRLNSCNKTKGSFR